MGVKTSVWGPYAWMVLEGLSKIANSSRECLNEYINILLLIPTILPCIHCRRSTFIFLTTGDTCINKLNCISATTHIYLLHEAVNHKLGKSSISYNDANHKMNNGVEDSEFWDALVRFLSFILCDFREDINNEILEFLMCIQRLLSFYGADLSAISEIRNSCNKYMAHWKTDKRLRCVAVHEIVNKLHNMGRLQIYQSNILNNMYSFMFK